MSVIKSFAIEDNEAKTLIIKPTFLKSSISTYVMECLLICAINTVTDLGPIIVIGFGAYLAINGSITVGTLCICRILGTIIRTTEKIGFFFTTLTQSFASMDRVFQLMDEDYDIKMVLALNLLKLNKDILS